MGLISIIMPVRNAMPYLQECLDSIVHQSYPDWELIAVNDHSEDLSFQMLTDYALKHTRIQCFQNRGKGIIDALNTGFSNSKGRFITRMDADDIMPTPKLRSLSEILREAGPGHVSTGKVKYISDNELGNGFRKYQDWLNALCDRNNHYYDIYKECVIPSPCWMMHREDFESIGGFESESYPEDYDLCFRMYEHQIKIVPSQEVLHIWRDHGGRASRNDENYSDNRFLDLKIKYFLRNDFQTDNKLIVWGAGKKGKNIARLLLENNVAFDWLTNNTKKIDKHIYGQLIKDANKELNLSDHHSIIVAVANEDEQDEILKVIPDFAKGNVYFFC